MSQKISMLLNFLPALFAAGLLAADDEERLDVVVREELVAVPAAPRLHVERVVQVLQGGAGYVHPTGTKAGNIVMVKSNNEEYSFQLFVVVQTQYSV